VTAPIGPSAAHMDILIDDQKLDRVERRFVSAVRSLRKRMEGEPSVASCMGTKAAQQAGWAVNATFRDEAAQIWMDSEL
jgi:hypothetical protein